MTGPYDYVEPSYSGTSITRTAAATGSIPKPVLVRPFHLSPAVKNFSPIPPPGLLQTTGRCITAGAVFEISTCSTML